MKTHPILVVILVLAVFGLGFGVRALTDGPAEGGDPAAMAGAGQQQQATRWTCSMHPQIILPSNDQKCPICFMDLIPLRENTDEGLGPDDLALSDQALALADIRTTRVRRGPATRNVRLVGMVQADEARIRTITAQVAGRLDRLFVDTTGQMVAAGSDLAEIYSPELYSAQAELQAALAHPGLEDAAASVRKRLRLWGMDERQIDALGQGGALKQHLMVKAPAGGVVLRRHANPGDYVNLGTVLYTIADLSDLWVTLEAYEADLSWLREGQEVDFTARAYPGRHFEGRVIFINPVVDPGKRTVEVRLQVPNPQGLLKPGMLVTGQVQVALDATGQPRSVQEDDPAPGSFPLLIPDTAPLLTGDRAVVYLRREENGKSVFTGRQITLGPRTEGFYVVAAGLEDGDEIVSHGAFKVDSALQIQAKASMMSREAVDPVFVESLGAFLTRYYALQTALAGDDDVAALQAVRELHAAWEPLTESASRLTTQGRVFWSAHAGELTSALDRVLSAENIARRRLAFEPLSDQLWLEARQFGQGTGLAVRRFHCPMAMDGAGAYWLQDHATVANPYYGDTMLRCGSEVEVLQ